MGNGLTNRKFTSGKGMEKSDSRNIWLIAGGKHIDYDFSRIYKGAEAKNIIEYKISDLAQYMLNPNPIKVDRKLVGCEIHYHHSSNKIKDGLRKILPKQIHGLLKNEHVPPDVLMADCPGNEIPFKDGNLESHFNNIDELLRPYHPIIKKLLKLDRNKIADVVGVCRDIAGNDSYLNIKGNIEEKIAYVRDSILKDVDVILDKAHISDGLFEMKGFNFLSKRPMKSHWLIKFLLNGEHKACVLDSNNQIEYWVDDINLLYYLQLFEQLLKEDKKLIDSLNLCTAGKAEPFKLFFNKQLVIDYSDGHFPVIYKELFEMYNIEARQRNIVAKIIGKSQLGISFHYVPHSHLGERKMFTNISVLHNVKALESIRDDLPQLYSEINKRASITGAGKFYLLDTIRGHKDEK